MNASHHAQVRIKENDPPGQLNRDSTIVAVAVIMHYCKNKRESGADPCSSIL